jgi:hypothetical protein
MTLLGSRKANDLDANSAHALKLREWFSMHGFEVKNAIQERLAAGFLLRGMPKLAAVIRTVPSIMFVVFEPLVPGFVYILVKPRMGTEKAAANSSGSRKL